MSCCARCDRRLWAGGAVLRRWFYRRGQAVFGAVCRPCADVFGIETAGEQRPARSDA